MVSLPLMTQTWRDMAIYGAWYIYSGEATCVPYKWGIMRYGGVHVTVFLCPYLAKRVTYHKLTQVPTDNVWREQPTCFRFKVSWYWLFAPIFNSCFVCEFPPALNRPRPPILFLQAKPNGHPSISPPKHSSRYPHSPSFTWFRDACVM